MLSFLFAGIQFSHSQSLSPAVVSSSGSFFIGADNTSLSSTLGELAIRTIQSADFILTQGFQQPELTISSSIPDLMIGWEVSAWPNPVINDLHIFFKIPSSATFFLELFDLEGRKILINQIRVTDDPFLHTLELNGIYRGIYLLKIYSKDHSIRKIIKIEKF